MVGPIIFLLTLCLGIAGAADCTGECDAKDQNALLQSHIDVHAESSLHGAGSDGVLSVDASFVQDVTTVEVDMATTKVFEGVPVFNYHLANPSGMNPSAIELSEAKKWILNFDSTATDADEKAFCENPPGNSKCFANGHPSEDGVAFVVLMGTEEELRQILRDHPKLKPRFVEPDSPVSTVPEIDEKEEGNSFLDMGEQSVASWGLDRIDDKNGLDGSYSVPSNSKAGAGAHVYVADTGVRTSHVDFEGRALPSIEALSSTVKECNGDTTCAFDRHGHGTHCAGTVGGKLYGVAKKTALYAVKVLGDRGGGSFSGIIASVDWVASKGKKPAVWSASLGGRGVMHSIETTFKAAMGKGVTISVAAGNSRADACGYSPAFAPSALTVGATQMSGSQDARAAFSSFGKCVDIFAPGVNIRSASARSDTGSATMSGTSMACPHVSGAAALFLADNPGMSPHALEKHMKAQSLQNLVKDPRGPNLFLYVGGATSPPGPSPTQPPNPPSPGPPPSTSDELKKLNQKLTTMETMLQKILAAAR